MNCNSSSLIAALIMFVIAYSNIKKLDSDAFKLESFQRYDFFNFLLTNNLIITHPFCWCLSFSFCMVWICISSNHQLMVFAVPDVLLVFLLCPARKNYNFLLSISSWNIIAYRTVRSLLHISENKKTFPLFIYYCNLYLHYLN